MANETNKTTEILVFEVDQGKGLTDLEKMRKTLVGLKEEQKELNKAYKAGTITQDEYVREITRVDAILKKVTTDHGTLQKSMTGVQTQTDKLIKSNAALSKSMTDAAGQINIAGVNVGQLGTKISALANPVTATVAIVGALGAAYARSTEGAKDLAFASSQLSSAVTLLTNDFARLITSSEDGEGAVTRIFNSILNSLGPAGVNLANQSKALALMGEVMEDLGREEIRIRGEVSDRLAENQELLTAINDEQTKYQDKLIAVSGIIGNLRTNQRDLLSIAEQQLSIITAQAAADENNEDLQTLKLQKEREISKIKADTEKKIQAILRLEDNVKTANESQAKASGEKAKQLAVQTSELERQQRIAALEREQAGNKTELEKFIEDNQVKVGSVTSANKAMGDASEALAKKVLESDKKQKESNQALIKSGDARLDSVKNFSAEAARILQISGSNNKAFASAQLAVDAALTLSGITRQAASITDPKQAALYKAAAFLSAGASLAQAVKLLGSGDNGITNAFTGAGGQQFVTNPDGSVTAIDAPRGQGLAEIGSSAISGAALGASIGTVVPVIGTAIGAVVGGVIGLVSGLFKRRKRNSGYATGGWTGPGGMYDVAGVVHADEYVTPKFVVNKTEAQPHLKALEQMRTRGYAQGGYVGGLDSMNSMIDMLKNATFEVAVTEINKGQNRYAKKVMVANGMSR